MTKAPRSPAAVRSTRGKTVGVALLKSYLHDFENRGNPDYRPLYTQAQFNRMVAGLRSEVEHRVYAQYIALYNGIVEEFARAHGYYQQTQNAMGRLLAHLSDATRAQEAECLLAQVPGYEADSAQPISLAALVLRALHYYTEHSAPPEGSDLAEAIASYRKACGACSPVDGQLSFLPGEGPADAPADAVDAYHALAAAHPALVQALLADIARQGIDAGEALRGEGPDTAVATARDLAWRQVYDYGHGGLLPQQRTPLQALRALFCGLEQLQDDPLDIEQLREELYLPALRWLCAYNLLIDALAGALALPGLSVLRMEEENQRLQLGWYSAQATALREGATGPDRAQKEAVAARLFPAIEWPTIRDAEAADAILQQARDLDAYEGTTVQRLVLALAEAIQ